MIQELKSFTSPETWLNIRKYDIVDPTKDSYKKLVEKGRSDLQESGACEWPDFVTDHALNVLKWESGVLEQSAFFKPVEGNAYLSPHNVSEFAADHPVNRTEPTRVGVVAYDQFPEISLLKRIYESPVLQTFVKDLLGLKELFTYADPFGALNLSVMVRDDYLRWHFDQTDFVTSLSIQNSREGGDFECVPMIRTVNEENYDEVSKVLSGDRSRVKHIKNKPGTLLLFRGRYSIHRVTPIQGDQSRFMGLLGYDSKPGVMSTPHLRDMRYGRQTALAKRPSFEDLQSKKSRS